MPRQYLACANHDPTDHPSSTPLTIAPAFDYVERRRMALLLIYLVGETAPMTPDTQVPTLPGPRLIALVDPRTRRERYRFRTASNVVSARREPSRANRRLRIVI